MSLPGRLIDVDGLAVYVHRSGEGPALVLLHGFPLSHWSFRHVAPALARAGEVIAIDLPGFGESDRPSPASYAYNPWGFAHTVLGVLDRLGIERGVWLGHGLGGLVALAAAREAAARVAGLVLVATPSAAPALPPSFELALVPGMGSFWFRRLLGRSAFAALLRRFAGLSPGFVSAKTIDYYWERLCRPGGREAAHATLEALSSSRPTAHAEAETEATRVPPALIVWGEQDAFCPMPGGRALAREVGAPFVVIPAAGHLPHEERPEPFVTVVAPFLGKVLGAIAGKEGPWPSAR